MFSLLIYQQLWFLIFYSVYFFNVIYMYAVHESFNWHLPIRMDRRWRDYHAFKLFKFFKICTYIMIIIPVKLV